MPMTPASPYVSVAKSHGELEHALAIKEEEEFSSAPSSPEPAEVVSSTLTSPAKRIRSEDDEDVTTSPSKRRLSLDDMIPNPFCSLAKQGVPMAYIEKHLLRVGAPFFNNSESSVCLIKAVQARTSRKGVLRATVIPRRSPEDSFSLGFSADTEQEDTEEVLVKATASSVIMPLHTELALLRAPILGRLLLSGHVMKGDMIEIELPHPHLFYDVMHWMYTGKMGQKEKEIKECIDTLWGR